MPITLNGTTGIVGPDGSAATPAIRGTDTNTGIFFPAADTIAFAEGGTEVMRIDSSGNVGLGVTPSAWGSNFKAVQLGLGGNIGAQTGARTIELACNAYNNSGWKYQATDKATLYYQYDGGHYWSRAASGTAGNAITFTDVMALDSSGNLLFNKTSTAASSSGICFQTNDTSQFYRGGDGSAIQFFRSATQVGRIDVSGSATSYVTSSDYRLKEDVQPMTGALAKVAALKPVTYKWKVDGSDGEGFIAHELAEVVPDCVTGEKDAVDAEGNPVYQGIDTSFLVATLTAAIQEQQAIITSLTARIAALEGAAQ
jgi:hypothetical protein